MNLINCWEQKKKRRKVIIGTITVSIWKVAYEASRSLAKHATT